MMAYRQNVKDEAQVQTFYIQQQKQCLKLGKLYGEPRQAILDNLSSAIQEWKTMVNTLFC
jgi:hypothetical protein